MKKGLGLILCVLVLVAIAACTERSASTPPTEILDGILSSLSAEDVAAIKGTVSIDGSIVSDIDGRLDGLRKESAFQINGVYYYFYDGMRLRETTGGGEIIEYVSFQNALVKYCPFSLYSYTHDTDYVDSVSADGNTVTVRFLGKGGGLNFASPTVTAGGTLTLTLKNGTLFSSIFSSTYTENKITHVYTARYEYHKATAVFPTRPIVTPSDSVLFGNYFIKQAIEKHAGQTLYTVSSNYNTKVSLSAFLTDASKLEKVVVLNSGTATRSITFVYKEVYPVIGLNNIQSMTFIFSPNYTVSKVYRNENQEQYYLK